MFVPNSSNIISQVKNYNFINNILMKVEECLTLNLVSNISQVFYDYIKMDL